MLDENWIELFVKLACKTPVISTLKAVSFSLEHGGTKLLPELYDVSSLRTASMLEIYLEDFSHWHIVNSLARDISFLPLPGTSTFVYANWLRGRGRLPKPPCNVVDIGDLLQFGPSQLGDSGRTDALTATNRTCSPRVFILETTTSRVAPLDSRRI